MAQWEAFVDQLLVPVTVRSSDSCKTDLGCRGDFSGSEAVLMLLSFKPHHGVLPGLPIFPSSGMATTACTRATTGFAPDVHVMSTQKRAFLGCVR